MHNNVKFSSFLPWSDPDPVGTRIYQQIMRRADRFNEIFRQFMHSYSRVDGFFIFYGRY